MLTVQVLSEAFEDTIGLLNPEPSEQFECIFDSIKPSVEAFDSSKSIPAYVNESTLASIVFYVRFNEVCVCVCVCVRVCVCACALCANSVFDRLFQKLQFR